MNDREVAAPDWRVSRSRERNAYSVATTIHFMPDTDTAGYGLVNEPHFAVAARLGLTAGNVTEYRRTVLIDSVKPVVTIAPAAGAYIRGTVPFTIISLRDDPRVSPSSTCSSALPGPRPAINGSSG